MPLVNCESNFILNWSANWVISNGNANQASTFAITNTKLYLRAVTLSTVDNAKQFQKLKLGFKCTINWNKYHSKKHWILQTHI